MKYVLRLAALCWTVLLPACTDGPTNQSGGESAAVDRVQLCKDGGATLNAASNECVCAPPQAWNGIRCAAAGAGTPPPGNHPVDQRLNADGSHESAAIQLGQGQPPALAPVPAPKPAAATAPAAAVVGDPRVATACKRAKGAWLEMEGYCRCPKNQVLVGQVCRTLPGRVTDDVCIYAVHRGKWKAGDCQCADGLVFAPSRGGCVPRMRGDATVLRRECESSLNLGHWDVAQDRCRCPAGRVWKGELCQVQNLLSSLAVCESEFNRGQWDGQWKRCACPAGKVWRDQTCRSPRGLSPETLCTSEGGGGQWNAAAGRCICPGTTKWDAAASTCQ